MGLVVLILAALVLLPGRGAAQAPLAPAALVQLTRSDVDAMPCVSADGTWVAFHSRRKAEKDAFPTRNIWTMSIDGGKPTKITEGPGEKYHPAISPNGTRIAYVSEAAGSRDIWVVNRDGTNPVGLTNDPGMEIDPAWSPDGRQIAFAALGKDASNFDLWLINADGSGRRRLTSSIGNEVFPAWHPNGKSLAYVTDANGQFDIYRLSVTGEEPEPLITGPAQETRPAWSRDGTKLAFTRWPADGTSAQAQLWIANADGSVPIELATAAGSLHPSWTPDGGALVFQRRTGTALNLWRLQLPDSARHATRLSLAAQLAGTTDDVVRLRNGQTVRGALQVPKVTLQTSYATMTFRRAVLSQANFGGPEMGLIRVILTNGDTFSGFWVTPTTLRLRARAGEQVLRREAIASITWRPESTTFAAAPRWVLRNGDTFSGRFATAALHLRVGSRTIPVKIRELARLEFSASADKAQVVLTGGDRLTGVLAEQTLAVKLAAGGTLRLAPQQVRMVTVPHGTAPGR
ncbi:MAG: TolB family protein [Candidatus Binatia bacterium]